MYFQVDGTNLRIVGSIHAFPAHLPSMPSWICEAYEWADEIYLESDTSKFVPYARLSEGESLVS